MSLNSSDHEAESSQISCSFVSKLRCKDCKEYARTVSCSDEWGDESQWDGVLKSTFEALEKSAANGCDICRLVRQVLIYRTSSLEDLEIWRRDKDRQVTWTSEKAMASKMREVHATIIKYGVYGSKGRVRVNLPIRAFELGQEQSLVRTNGLGRDVHQAGQQILSWIQESEKSEAFLTSPFPRSAAGNPKEFPTRLLQIGYNSNPFLRIIDTHELDAGKEHRYMTLSYCWGQSNEPAKTTISNLSDRKKSIDFNALPRTIQEFIMLARAMEVPYVWVDAICIIQPHSSDTLDWELESAKMGQYYDGSFCTIAATGATDSSDGLFGPWPSSRFATLPCCSQRRLHPQAHPSMRHLVLSPTVPGWDECVEKSPLYRRAWAIQERLLSKRVVHMSQHGIMWECELDRASEYEVIPRRQPSDLMGPIPVFQHDWYRTTNHEVLLGSTWFAFLEWYSNSSLTCPTDRLPAVSGFVKKMRSITSGTYIAGLWQETISFGLLWSVKLDKKALIPQPQDYIGPSVRIFSISLSVSY
jgi:hypothetical protein